MFIPLLVLAVAALACSRSDLPFPTPGPGVGSEGMTHVAPGSSSDPRPLTGNPTPATVQLPGGPPRLTPTPDPPHAIAATRQSAQEYIVQAGDTLGIVAQRFGLTIEELILANGLGSPDLLSVGQVLIIPVAQDRPAGPSFKIIPDSGLVYGPTTIGFSVREFVEAKGGYLARYSEVLPGRELSGFDEELAGAELLELVAIRHSVNPRLLLALLEFQSGWVTQADPGGTTVYPMGLTVLGQEGLFAQLKLAADSLNTGYYGWRAGYLSTWAFPSGGIVGIDLTINAGTAGVQHFFSNLYDEPRWTRVVSDGGFISTYEALFGYPFDPTEPNLIPNDLTQPELRLPFETGKEWAFTGGPHGGWDSGSAWAALDFAPPAEFEGCTRSDEWIAASAPGQVVRASHGAVVQDLDGDGYEQTGWVLFYMHIESRGRVAAGTRLQAGDRIGHPSCEGGYANGTHLHFARKYNGEWIAADGPIPFILDGWVSSGLGREYDGLLTKGDVSIEACDCRAAGNAITR